MTDSMIERIVFAVRKKRFEREGLRFSREHARPPTDAELEDAHTVLEAVLEPTETMLAAADSAIPRFEEPTDGGHRLMGRDGSLIVWQTMHAAALSETTT